MLTDAEVADTARQLLADELADLTPPAALLSAVRCRHAVGRRRRRAATATLACAAAAGVTAATLATATGPDRAHPAVAGSQLLHVVSGPELKPATQTITLDGYTISLRAPLRAVSGPHGALVAFSFAASSRSGHSAPSTFAFLFRLADQVPAAAVAVRVRGHHLRAYLLRAGGRLSLFLPLPAADGRSRYLVLQAQGPDEAILLRISTSMTFHLVPALR